MSFFEIAHEKFLFPFYEGVLKARRTADIYRNALNSQWLTLEEHRQKQLHGLKEILYFAQTNSVYWKNLFGDFDFSPQKIASIAELSQFPILSKDIIRNNFEDLVCSPFRNTLWRKSTGGSTGQPLQFGYTKESYEWRVAMSKRGYSWVGAGPGTKQVHIWGVNFAPQGVLKLGKEKFYHFLNRCTYFNCFDLGPKQMAVWLRALNKIRPDVIIGYANPLYEFARFASARGGLAFQPKAVLSAAEKLHSFQRETVEGAFGCKTFNTYGSREFMLIAAECEKREGLHVSMENLIVEVVDESGQPVKPGEVGRVLITDLHNYGMPFIRYEIGDLARVSEQQCSCGRGLMLLDDIIGRSLDVIRTPEGKTLAGQFFSGVMMNFKDVYRYQVIQNQIDQLQVKLVPCGAFSDATRSAIERHILGAVGSKMFVTIEVVSEIPLTPSGKYRFIVSNLDKVVP